MLLALGSSSKMFKKKKEANKLSKYRRNFKLKITVFRYVNTITVCKCMYQLEMCDKG